MIPRIPRKVIVFTMPAGFLCVLGFWCFQCFLHILLTTADIADAVVVNLHGLGRVFRPLYLFLVDHDPLNEQPQQLWRQLRDIRVPLCFIKEAVRPVPGFPQALDLSFCGIPVAIRFCSSV